MKIILEGEEEVGSANLDNFIKRTASVRLKADVVVISDSPMFDRGIPSICYGLRGLVYCQIDLARHEERPPLRVRSAARSRTRRWSSRRCSRR